MQIDIRIIIGIIVLISLFWIFSITGGILVDPDLMIIEKENFKNRLSEVELVKNIGQVESAIEIAVNLNVETNFDFTLPKCFNETEAKLRIIERNDYCSVICGGKMSQCTILQFSSKTPSFSTITCLAIPLTTSFSEDYSNCNQLPNAVDLKSSNGIKPGQYTVIKNIETTEYSPKLCAYKQNTTISS